MTRASPSCTSFGYTVLMFPKDEKLSRQSSVCTCKRQNMRSKFCVLTRVLFEAQHGTQKKTSTCLRESKMSPAQRHQHIGKFWDRNVYLGGSGRQRSPHNLYLMCTCGRLVMRSSVVAEPVWRIFARFEMSEMADINNEHQSYCANNLECAPQPPPSLRLRVVAVEHLAPCGIADLVAILH